MAYIYKITNKINGKSYIGKTEQANPNERFRQHINDSNKERCKDRPLYRAFRKYGVDNFLFKVLEETDNPSEREKELIKEYGTYGSTGYNATLGGDGASYIDEGLVIETYQLGLSMREVAKRLDICVDSVSNILKRNNIPLRNNTLLLGRPVLQLDKNTDEIIAEFNSIGEAARAFGNYNYNANIARVCNGKRKTALGYKWKYK